LTWFLAFKLSKKRLCDAVEGGELKWTINHRLLVQWNGPTTTSNSKLPRRSCCCCCCNPSPHNCCINQTAKSDKT